MMSDHVAGNGMALSDHGQSFGRVGLCTSVSEWPQSLHPGTETRVPGFPEKYRRSGLADPRQGP